MLNVVLLAGAVYVREYVNHQQLVTVQVAAGSEDQAFLQDPRVLAEFASKGLNVEITPFGSGQLASTIDRTGYDAFFLSSQVFADEAEIRLGSFTEFQPFSTPLMVFTWLRLVPLLKKIGIVNSDGQFDIGRYLEVAGSGMRWDQIPGNTFYANPNQVLLEMTDPAESDSGAMFVAAASYGLNRDQMVSDESQVKAVAPAIANALGKLGEMPPTTNDVYLNYRRGGVNGTPLALGYESEWRGAQPASVGPLPAGAVGLPLDLPVSCVHVVIAFGHEGKTFGKLLTSDRVLQSQEQKYGFETGTVVTDPGPGFAINAPTAPLLKKLIDDVEAQL